MKKIDDGVVFSNDIIRILNGYNALDFNYLNNGMIVPDNDFISEIRKDFYLDAKRVFNGKVTIINEDDMLNETYDVIKDIINKYPIISLDKVYLKPDKNVFFLDCTRLDGSNKIVSRNNPDVSLDVNINIKNLACYFKKIGISEIILFDDVVFSGGVLQTIIEEFNKYQIQVIGIRSLISTYKSYVKFNDQLPYGLKCSYLLDNNVIDQICERDFYFGIVQGGILVLKNNLKYKSYYFKPFGNPVVRASVPKEQEKDFSLGCISRSIKLWEEINRKSNKEFYVSDLPEKIYLADEDEKIVKVLKKGMGKL